MTDSVAQSIALSLGVSALVTAACRKARIPALLPLIVVGVGLGTSGLGVIDASSLGPVLKGAITVAIGLLIFEGALHLNKEELSRAPGAVWRLLTFGALVTWVGSSVAAKALLDLSWPISILLGAALIVTGPTVVQPILRVFHVSPRVRTALSAEAVLIDPIGVVATITTLEMLRLMLSTESGASIAGAGLWAFVRPFIGGAGVGIVMGLVGQGFLWLYGKAGKVEPPLLNLLAVGVCMSCVGVGEAIVPEAGLAAVTICGVIMARARVLGATELRSFKELLAVMLVGTLFVLLSSRFDLSQLSRLTWRAGAFVLVLLFLIRPLAVAVSTYGSKLTWPERIFAGTFAPRGIVALSVIAIASAELSALEAGTAAASAAPLESGLLRGLGKLEPMMFITIVGTVLLGSTVSPVLAWALRLRAGEESSVIIVGGHALGVALARELGAAGVAARIIDSNEARVAAAKEAGCDALCGDATDSRWMDDVGAAHGAGWLVAWTGNHDVDQLAGRWALERFGDGRAGIWSSKPARGDLEKHDMSRGLALAGLIDEFEAGRARVGRASAARDLDMVIGWVHEGRFELMNQADQLLPPKEARTFIGLTGAGSDPARNSGPLFLGKTAFRTGTS